MAAHSHDGIDWNTRLQRLRDRDALTAPETGELAHRLLRPTDRSVIDVGAGAGGAAAAFASALRGGAVSGAVTGDSAVVTLVDSAPELLSAAADDVEQVGGPEVRVRSVVADASSDEEMAGIEQSDLVFASLVAHHLPDQSAGLRRFARLARPGGRLALVEFGLEPKVLPWDIGIGEPGLEDRLIAARADWFRTMRAEMPGSVRLPVGWSKALADIGLVDVASWNYLIDRPAPLSDLVRHAVLRRLEWFRDHAQGRVGSDDVRTLDALLDADGPHHAGRRDDLSFTATYSVHVGTRS